MKQPARKKGMINMASNAMMMARIAELYRSNEPSAYAADYEAENNGQRQLPTKNGSRWPIYAAFDAVVAVLRGKAVFGDSDNTDWLCGEFNGIPMAFNQSEKKLYLEHGDMTQHETRIHAAVIVAYALIGQEKAASYGGQNKTITEMLADINRYALEVVNTLKNCEWAGTTKFPECHPLTADTVRGTTVRPHNKEDRFQIWRTAVVGEVDLSAPMADKADAEHERELDFSEEEMVYTMQPNDYVPMWVKKVAAMYKATKHLPSDKRKNLHFAFGDAGCGKSHAIKVLSSVLHLPYTFFNCEPGTDISDLLGKMMPSVKEPGKFDYIESNFLRAVRNGWICAIEEPNIIEKPAVLAGLNSLFDGTGAIVIPQTGETVRIHPDTLIIMTSNVTYSGCTSMNASVLSRCGLKINVSNRPKSETVKMLMAETGFTDQITVEKMVDCAEEVQAKIKELQLDNAVCGYREVENWVLATKMFGDPYAQAIDTLLPCISLDINDNALFLDSIQKYFSAAMN